MATDYIVENEDDVFSFASALMREYDVAKRPLKVSVKIDRGTYSDRQLAYFWAVCRLIAEHTGYEPNEMHDLFCSEYLGFIDREINGKNISVLRTITYPDRLDVQEMSIFIEKMLNWISVNFPEFRVPEPPARRK